MSKLALSIGKSTGTYSPILSSAKEKEDAWLCFATYIKIRDAIKTTQTLHKCRCFTCGKVLDLIKDTHAGHFLPGRTGAILFDFVQVNGQCFRCNRILHGNWPVYEKKMIELYGYERVEAMKIQRTTILKWKAWEYREMRDKCIRLLVELVKPYDLYAMLKVDHRIINKLKDCHVLILEKTAETKVNGIPIIRFNPEFDCS